MIIDRSYETMTSHERFRRTINYEKTDRIPINYHSSHGVDARLKAYFALKSDDNEELRQILGHGYHDDGRWILFLPNPFIAR